MNLLWKGAAVLGLAVAGLGAAATPAQAQYYRDYGGYDNGYRDGWRGDRDWDRRWDGRRDWREHRRHWRGDRRHWRGYRERCWNEWRYSYRLDRQVRVRICR